MVHDGLVPWRWGQGLADEGAILKLGDSRSSLSSQDGLSNGAALGGWDDRDDPRFKLGGVAVLDP